MDPKTKTRADKYDSDVRKCLTKAIKKAGSINELSRKLGFRRQTIASWDKGYARPRMENLDRIESYLKNEV